MPLGIIADRFVSRLASLSFAPPVTHVYNPLSYARAGYDRYVERFGQGRREVLLIGMNPGPWGMAQTGVPFGEVAFVRDWMGICEEIDRPTNEHPKRPIDGFNCERSEVSGRRLWGWAAETFGSPESFFGRFFVANYCPLMFMEASGKNRTPDRLPNAEKTPLMNTCDDALRQTVDHFRPEIVVGIGAFAHRRAEVALSGLDVRIARVLHPSPASPAANRGWSERVTQQLTELGVKLPATKT